MIKLYILLSIIKFYFLKINKFTKASKSKFILTKTIKLSKILLFSCISLDSILIH